MAKILIIEDEASILLLLKRILAMARHEVVTAMDGDEAGRLAAEQHFDLIISDLSLASGLSGIDLVRELRRVKPDCPLVVSSGHTEGEQILTCQELGVTDFLPKPFDIVKVRGFVDDVLKRAALTVPV
jgi:DNA-binding NtrC family response regulator